MQNLKNIGVGFLISFIGSIPLGYLNVVGFDIYSQKGIWPAVYYLLGVILVEAIVIYFTLIFAHKLAANKKLTQYIEGFSVLFLFILAYVFYASADAESSNKAVFANIGTNYFFAGLFLSAVNFIQLPFWTGWNLYLLNGNYIDIAKSRKYFYVFGTVLGTFCGMLALILSLHFISLEIEFFKIFLFQSIIPLVFIVFGVLQAVKFYRKYYW